jgi:hypothetical protein
LHGGTSMKQSHRSMRPWHLAIVLAALASGASPALAVGPEGGAAPLANAPAAASALASEGFVLMGERKGVRVFQRDKRKGLEFAAEGTFAASPERVQRVLIDYPSHGKWQKHLKTNRVLARGPDFLDVYQRMSVPIIDDRDYTLHVTWGDEGGVRWTRFVTANDKGPGPTSGVVRIRDHTGAFRLEPANHGTSTHAVYRFYIDLAGSVPMWAARGQALGDIAEFFVNIGKQLPSYR